MAIDPNECCAELLALLANPTHIYCHAGTRAQYNAHNSNIEQFVVRVLNYIFSI